MTGGGDRPAARGWHLRPAVVDDVPSIAAIEAESFSDPWSAASFRGLVSRGLVWFMTAVDDASSAVIGYIVVWFAADEAEVANIAVAPSVRGGQVGAGMLDAALDAARERGTARMFLEVRDSNERARALYRSRGFEEVGRRPRYYRRPVEDGLILRRVLESQARAEDEMAK